MTMTKSFLFNLLLALVFGLGIYFFELSKWNLLIPVLFFLSDLILGSIFIERNFYITSINFLPPHRERQLCLTFDDGIHPDLTPKVLDVLKEKNVKAVFFLIGKNIPGNEHIVKRMHQEGHQMGNHSYEHSAWFDLKSSKSMLLEIEQTNAIIESITGEKVLFFRPPYGVTNPNLAKAIRHSKLKSIGWRLRSMDTVAKSKEQLLNKLKLNTKARDIILLHDRCELTLSALTEYIDYCLDRGFKFVTLNAAHEESK